VYGFSGIPDIGFSALINNPLQLALDIVINSAILAPDYIRGLNYSIVIMVVPAFALVTAWAIFLRVYHP
jgi:hypothetical protein